MRIVWIVALAAFVLRAGWVLVRWAQHGLAFEFDDETLHWQLATNLVTQGSLVSDDGRYAARMPLYPLALAPFAALGTYGILAARLAQAAIGALAVLLAGRLARTAGGRLAGLAAATLVALDPFAIFFCNLLLTETLFSLLALAIVYASLRVAIGKNAECRVQNAEHNTGEISTGGPASGRSLREKSADSQFHHSQETPHTMRPATGRSPRFGFAQFSSAALGVGLAGAAAVMTRPSSLGWIVLSWLVLWVIGVRNWRESAATGGFRDDIRKHADPPHKKNAARLVLHSAFRILHSPPTLRLVLWAAILAIVLLPWGLRNRAVLGGFAWLSANGGVTLYDAQGPHARGDSDQSFLQEMPELAELGEIERDRRLHDAALRQMRENPSRVLSLAWTKFLRTWSLTPNVAEYRAGATAWASALYTAAVLLLTALAALRLRSGRTAPPAGRAAQKRLLLLVALAVAYFTLLHCIYVGSLRYRVPLMPLLAVAGALAVAGPKSAAESEYPDGADRPAGG